MCWRGAESASLPAPQRPTAPLIKYVFKKTIGAPPKGPPPLIRRIRHPGQISLFPLMFLSKPIDACRFLLRYVQSGLSFGVGDKVESIKRPASPRPSRGVIDSGDYRCRVLKRQHLRWTARQENCSQDVKITPDKSDSGPGSAS